MRHLRRILKLLHFAGTGWFSLSAAYILVLELRHAGLKWWVIFSLSGYSFVIWLLLVSLYLYAIFRGISRNEKTRCEHPLTNTIYYTALYYISPFLGTLAACLAILPIHRLSHYLQVIAVGTLATTFLVWIILDPAVGFVETLLPASRVHRKWRLGRAKVLRKRRQKQHEQVLAEIEARERQNRQHWQQALQADVDRLVQLLDADNDSFKQARDQAMEIGVKAWQRGGLSCMRFLYEMTMEAYRKKYATPRSNNYISGWWDGIGQWRNHSGSKKIL